MEQKSDTQTKKKRKEHGQQPLFKTVAVKLTAKPRTAMPTTTVKPYNCIDLGQQ